MYLFMEIANDNWNIFFRNSKQDLSLLDEDFFILLCYPNESINSVGKYGS